MVENRPYLVSRVRYTLTTLSYPSTDEVSGNAPPIVCAVTPPVPADAGVQGRARTVNKLNQQTQSLPPPGRPGWRQQPDKRILINDINQAMATYQSPRDAQHQKKPVESAEEALKSQREADDPRTTRSGETWILITGTAKYDNTRTERWWRRTGSSRH